MCVSEEKKETEEKAPVKPETKDIKVEDAEWEEVPEGDIFEFKKEGDFIEGTLIHLEKDVGQHKSKLYSLKLDDGKLIKFWGSKLLDGRMTGIEFGTHIKVVYGGLITPEKGNAYKTFTLLKKRVL